MKKCTICKELLPKTSFHKHPSTSDGRGSQCKECDKKAKREKRQSIKLSLVAIKGGACEVCGYSKCVDALDFHHKAGKNFEISSRKYVATENLIKEIELCMLLCANCHREIHSSQV